MDKSRSKLKKIENVVMSSSIGVAVAFGLLIVVLTSMYGMRNEVIDSVISSSLIITTSLIFLIGAVGLMVLSKQQEPQEVSEDE